MPVHRPYRALGGPRHCRPPRTGLEPVVQRHRAFRRRGAALAQRARRSAAHAALTAGYH